MDRCFLAVHYAPPHFYACGWENGRHSESRSTDDVVTARKNIVAILCRYDTLAVWTSETLHQALADIEGFGDLTPKTVVEVLPLVKARGWPGNVNGVYEVNGWSWNETGPAVRLARVAAAVMV